MIAAGAHPDTAERVALLGERSPVVADGILALAKLPGVVEFMTGVITPIERGAASGLQRKQSLPKDGVWIPRSDQDVAIPGESLFRSNDPMIRKKYGDIPFNNQQPDYSDHILLKVAGRLLGGRDPRDVRTGAEALGELMRTDSAVRLQMEEMGLTNWQKKNGSVHRKNIEEWIASEGLTWDHDRDLRTLQLMPRDLNDAVANLGGASVLRYVREEFGAIGIVVPTNGRNKGMTPGLIELAHFVGIIPPDAHFGNNFGRG